MDGYLLLPFVLATFVGGFVSGFSGFAMGIVVAGIWLHIITPIQTAALIAGYGLLTQGYGIAKLWHELNWRNIWPLVLGTAIGIPIGVMLLTHTNPILLAVWRRHIARCLCDVRPDTTTARTLQDRRSRRYCDRYFQRTARRPHRPWRHHFDHLVPIARVVQGQATRRLSTGVVCGVCDHLDLPTRRGIVLCRDPQIVWNWPAVHDRRHMERVQTLWIDQ